LLLLAAAAWPVSCGRGLADGPVPLPVCPDESWIEPPSCGDGPADRESLIPGPGQEGFDADLYAKAERFDRQFHALSAQPTGVNADLSVGLEMIDERALIEEFLTATDGWEFEEWSGRPVTDVVDQFQKAAGLYAGAGIAADAFRYGTLRDSGAPCGEVDRSREILIADMDVMHMATAITGVPGVIARGFLRTDVPVALPETVPLFDADGNPLPEDKDNGTWREDNSGGLYPDYVWEDSCSRDMYIGWALAMGSTWEVVRLDPSIPQQKKDVLEKDAADLARALMVEGRLGFDLEIPDADGRVTYHGYLHEEAFDRIYLPPSKNGQHAVMALGIVASLAFVAGQEDIDRYLYRTLIDERQLHVHARDMLGIVDSGVRSNYSNYNMAFIGGWLAHRYLCDPRARDAVREAVHLQLYDRPDRDRQPEELSQTFYDLVYVATRAGSTAFDPMGEDVDEAAIARGLETLVAFHDAPFWNEDRVNCDETEIEALSCEAVDGSTIELLGYVGRGDELVASAPLPIGIRPLSNYYWRSNPYSVNGTGDGSVLLPGVDFRLAYWMGRWVSR
jgi:hypothetical protein